jgi:hypothetical protein
MVLLNRDARTGGKHRALHDTQSSVLGFVDFRVNSHGCDLMIRKNNMGRRGSASSGSLRFSANCSFPLSMPSRVDDSCSVGTRDGDVSRHVPESRSASAELAFRDFRFTVPAEIVSEGTARPNQA